MATQTSNLAATTDPETGSAEESTRAKPLAGPEVASSPSSPVMLRKLYSTMLRSRMVEEKVSELAKRAEIPVGTGVRVGHEATAIGSMIELRRGDAISAEPGIATQVVCGRPLGYIFAELFGFASEYLASSSEVKITPIHLLLHRASVAGRLNVAAGFALARKMEQRDNVVVIELQDAFDALGFWHEAATLAAAERLPMIFVASSTPASVAAHGETQLRDRAEAYGLPGITVDGTDVVAVWRVTQESIHRARSGAGPTLVDCRESLPAFAKPKNGAGPRDPLAHMQHYLEKRKLWDDSWKAELTQQFAAEIKQAVQFSRKAAKAQ